MACAPFPAAPSPAVERGFSLIELMIGLTIIGVLMMLGLPSISEWLANSQIRTSSETTLNGLQLARAEAVRRNVSVRFQLVTTLTNTCALSTSGTNWVVSLEDPTTKCNIAPDDAVSPKTIQVKSSQEGGTNVTVAADASALVFNSLGRPLGAGNLTQIDFSNAKGGACQHAATPGPMRCLRIIVTTGGRIKMCDPKVTDVTDPRICA
jgi:type IV fimbrial biogenesis protein FimT